MCFHLYVVPTQSKFIKAEEISEVTKGSGISSLVFNGYPRVSVWDNENILETDGCTTVCKYLMPLNLIINMIDCMLCTLYHNFLKQEKEIFIPTRMKFREHW